MSIYETFYVLLAGFNATILVVNLWMLTAPRGVKLHEDTVRKLAAMECNSWWLGGAIAVVLVMMFGFEHIGWHIAARLNFLYVVAFAYFVYYVHPLLRKRLAMAPMKS